MRNKIFIALMVGAIILALVSIVLIKTDYAIPVGFVAIILCVVSEKFKPKRK